MTLGNFNGLSNLSKILYVDLIDQQDSLVQTIRLPIAMGVATGDFKLPPSSSNGSYRVRAYTNWMRNFNQGYFFDQYIQVLDPFLSSGHLGRAVEKNRSHDKENITDSGYSLSVNNLLDNNLIVEVKVDERQLLGQELNFLIQNEGEVFVAFKIDGKRASSTFSIPRSSLGEGVNEVMLFSKDMRLLTHQKVYSVSKSRQLNIKLSTTAANFSTRQKVRVHIGQSKEGESLTKGTFSASVINHGKIPYREKGNYFSSVTAPSAISSISGFDVLAFQSEIDDKRKLDSLLTMSEYVNIDEQLGENKIDFPAEKDFNISGRLSRFNGKPEPSATVTLLSPETGFMLDTISDADGTFKFDSLIFNDSTGFVVQAKTDKGKTNLRIEIDSIPHLQVNERSGYYTRDSVLNADDKFYIANNKERIEKIKFSEKKSILLEDVKVESKWSRSRVKHSSNLNGPGNANQVLFAEDLENCASLAYCLQGRLVGVTIRNETAYMLRSVTDPMGIIVDGVWLESGDLDLVPPVNIETIEVLRDASKLTLYGGRAGGGLLIITTKRGDRESIQKREFPGIISLWPKGFAISRVFYSPDYSDKEEDSGERDMRATIYWNPNILIGENGDSFFEFYTSDEPGTYSVTLRGIDYEGKIGYSELKFEVN